VFKSGELRHAVSLQRYVETRTASGHAQQTWSTYATVRARFRTLSGHERLAAQQAKAVLTHEITIRYRSDVHPDHRILWGSRTFDLKDVRSVDERNVELRMLASEVLTAGPVSSGSPSSSASASPSASSSSSASA